MKSIKPGRGPSAMGALGSVIAVVFGIFWTFLTASMGAPVFFPVFGVLFVLLGIAQAVYHFKNASGKNRFSSFDIVDSAEEPDPWNRRFGGDVPRPENAPDLPAETGQEASRYCPYCGAPAEADFSFCPKCGRKLP